MLTLLSRWVALPLIVMIALVGCGLVSTGETSSPTPTVAPSAPPPNPTSTSTPVLPTSTPTHTPTLSPTATPVPTVEILDVPPYGQWPASLKGKVSGIDSNQGFQNHRIACYIRVENSWWTKPFFDNPTVSIDDEGQWECLTTTGGIDDQAVEFAAFLIVATYIPPRAEGIPQLPQEIFDHAVAWKSVEREIPAARTIQWSRYEWQVKRSSRPVGPGPNYFSDSEDNVWVDEEGNLHLRITNRNGEWLVPEVVSVDSLGHGLYRFVVASDIKNLNENVVLGLFTWETNPEVNNGEIDIEISRWGDPNNDNLQYVIQPFRNPGNMFRFDMDSEYSVHEINWRPEYIQFRSLDGENLIAEWNYTGPDIPSPGREQARINLWLNHGMPPSDGQEVEVVIEEFEFIPPPSPIVSSPTLSPTVVVPDCDTPSIPGIAFTNVPPYGDRGGNLTGCVRGADPSAHKLAVYIKVQGGWWTKPTFANPTVPIGASGNWETSIVTGGDDHLATDIAVYLIAIDYQPPRMLGGATLPAELEQNALAMVKANRTS